MNDNNVYYLTKLDATWTVAKLKHWLDMAIRLNEHLSSSKEPHGEIHRRHVRRWTALRKALDAVSPDFELEREPITGERIMVWHRDSEGRQVDGPFVPNAEQLAALRAFADRHSRKSRINWKDLLGTYWATGKDASEPDGHLLRQVRNQCGPTWLASFEL